jgi:(1->4)-alpha-D-glucan 1-alpha-D-glucosylmutase
VQRIPSSTYRLQLHAGFDFDCAIAVLDYLVALGVSHVYASPYLQAAPGSMHGYDVVDHKTINRELGGAGAHKRFCDRLATLGLGQILDIVPNHMSLAENNRSWWDVLENGPQSRYAQYFDIDWESGEARMRNKILLPILEDQYGLVLAGGSIKITRSGTRFQLLCGSTHLPVAPHSMAGFLLQAAETCHSDTLGFIADSLVSLAPQEGSQPEVMARQRRDRGVLFDLLDRTCAEHPEALDCLDAAIEKVNADTDALDAFLQLQNYRVAYWRAADEDLGYRRFFDVNSLIGLRVERKAVFDETHALILEWLRSGTLDGVRVDHPDGLRDPQRYFDRLRDAAPGAYIVAEKILARNEPLRESWPIDGTTGYDFLNMVNGLLVSPEGLSTLDELYQSLLPEPVDYRALVRDKKIAVMQEGLGSDVNRLTSIFLEICDRDRDHRDYSRANIRRAIREIAAGFAVYRTYINPDVDEVHDIDAAVIQGALDTAIQNRSDLDPGLLQFVVDVLLKRSRGELESEFLLRFQQFTGPVMAKGFEDTVLYCYNRLVGLNEVGSDPYGGTVSVEEFHRYNAHIQRDHPSAMVTLTTHDTKRGEDVRARLAVLSEVPFRFASVIARWFVMNSEHRSENMPDPNTEHLFYQTLIGAWPISVERAQAYMQKATREAKQKTSWTHNDEKFESALQEFIRKTLASEEFLAEIEVFVEEIQQAGRTNSLAQTLLKYTVPGVPDLYQGSELWDHRLVDPDNRAPVDFEQRRKLLQEVKDMSAEAVVGRMEEGLPKLWTIHHALETRAAYPQCFGPEGRYEPLIANGSGADHVVAFLRGDRIATVVPRLTVIVRDGWGDTSLELPSGRWRNVLSGVGVHGGECRIADLLSQFPVALLTLEG